jgi:hypothetical protein
VGGPDVGTLFDTSPIRIGGFELRATTAIEGEERPTFAGWQAAFEFATASERSSPFWVGDLLAYAEGRTEWKQKLDHAESSTGLSQQTLENRTTVSRKVQGRARELAPSLSHAAVVTSLDPDEQEELLEQAKTERWTVRELAQAKRARERTVRAEGGSESMYTVDVTVRLTREAQTETQASDQGWAAVKAAIAGLPHAHVIAAQARLSVGPVRVVRGKKVS